MIILGINADHGDSSAAIIKDGKLIAAIEEERTRRIKHWAGFPNSESLYQGIKMVMESNYLKKVIQKCDKVGRRLLRYRKICRYVGEFLENFV